MGRGCFCGCSACRCRSCCCSGSSSSAKPSRPRPWPAPPDRPRRARTGQWLLPRAQPGTGEPLDAIRYDPAGLFDRCRNRLSQRRRCEEDTGIDRIESLQRLADGGDPVAVGGDLGGIVEVERLPPPVAIDCQGQRGAGRPASRDRSAGDVRVEEMVRHQQQIVAFDPRRACEYRVAVGVVPIAQPQEALLTPAARLFVRTASSRSAWTVTPERGAPPAGGRSMRDQPARRAESAASSPRPRAAGCHGRRRGSGNA